MYTYILTLNFIDYKELFGKNGIADWHCQDCKSVHIVNTEFHDVDVTLS